MTKKDLRTIGREKRRALRERAMKAFQASQNVLETAKKLGINRQVLHSWIKKYGKDGNLEEEKR